MDQFLDTSPVKKMERKILTELIELYCDFPCLWDKESEGYKDRTQKIQAWSILRDKLKELDPEANIQGTKKRIDQMRFSYQRESRKIRESIKTASSDVHVPQLWYFQILRPVFEKKDKLSLKLEETFESDEEQLSKKIQGEKSSEVNTKYPSNSKKLKLEEIPEIQVLSPQDLQKRVSEKRQEEKNSKAKISHCKKLRLITTPQERLHDDAKQKYQNKLSERIQGENIGNAIRNNTSFDKKHNFMETAQPLRTDITKPNSFAVYVGEQLDQIATFQRQVAEKLISDVLFLGKTGRLHFNTRIEDHSMPPTLYSSSNKSHSTSPSPEYIQLSLSPRIQSPIEGGDGDPLCSLPTEEAGSNDSILKSLLQDCKNDVK